jgi:hypothetical protein
MMRLSLERAASARSAFYRKKWDPANGFGQGLNTPFSW